jgi:ankyrin repeat protein
MKKTLIIVVVTLISNLTFSQETLDVFDIARKGTLEQAKNILKVNPNAFKTVNSDGFSPLTLACYRGNNEVVKFLIDNGCDINQESSMGTPLMAAVVKGNVEGAKLLLQKNADPNNSDKNGTTALMYATSVKNYELVSLLTKANANPDVKDNRGNSALDYAILLNDDKLIELLKNK